MVHQQIPSDNALAVMASGDNRARLVPIKYGNMSPTLNPGDAVAAVPVDRYEGEGLYVLEMWPGRPAVYRVDGLGGEIRVSSDHDRHRGQDVYYDTLTLERFRQVVMARAIAHISVMDHSTFWRLAEEAGR